MEQTGQFQLFGLLLVAFFKKLGIPVMSLLHHPFSTLLLDSHFLPSAHVKIKHHQTEKEKKAQ
jgi:hypothetical protein